MYQIFIDEYNARRPPRRSGRNTLVLHTYLLHVVVEAGLELMVEDPLALGAEVEALEQVTVAAHLPRHGARHTDIDHCLLSVMFFVFVNDCSREAC